MNNKSESIHYHFFPASLRYYDNYNFSELQKEYEKYGNCIYWAISSENGKRVHSVKTGDICYIYYSGLPDGSNRILFIGKVIASDYDKKSDETSICPDAYNGILYAKLKISSISLEDKEQFSLNKLRSTYKLINKKGRIGYRKIKPNIKAHKDLINDIEKSKKDGTHTLITVNEHFNNNYCLCDFKDKDNKRNNHNTFIEANGFYYIERHHLVTRNLIKKYNTKIANIEKIVNDANNIFTLCPNCHREIHHAQQERRREKIEFLYQKNKKFFDTNFNELKGNTTTLEWLYSLYNCNNQK